MASQTADCPICGRSFEKRSEDAHDVCENCIAEYEVARAPEAKKRLETPKLKYKWAYWLGGAVLLGLLSLQIAHFTIKSGEEVVTKGSAPTNATQQCLSNLLKISYLIQSDRWPTDGFTCPVNKKAYRTAKENGDTIVYCPNPEEHGFKEMRVSRKFPTPQTIDK